MAAALASAKMDLRSHTMFSTKGEEKGPSHRDQVRLRLRSRLLNNTHLAERHSEVKNERELLDKRQETFRSFANVGIECPLLQSPTPRIYGARRRRVKRVADNPDVLTLAWDTSSHADNSPYIDEDPDDPVAPEWSVVLAEEQSVTKSIASCDRSEDSFRPKLPHQKSVTWGQLHGGSGASAEDWVKLVSPAYQRHLERHRPKKPSKPPFGRYAIGSLQKVHHAAETQSTRKAGVQLHPLSREPSSLVEASRPRGELHPVTSGLRQFGTAPEQIRWRHVRPGEWNVRKVWNREVSDFSNPPLVQMAREDTRQYLSDIDSL